MFKLKWVTPIIALSCALFILVGTAGATIASLKQGLDAPLSTPVGQTVQSKVQTAAQVHPDIGGEWTSGSPQWMTGVNWGGETFGNSIGKGKDFFGSNVAAGDYVPIQIEFSTTDTTLCGTFQRFPGDPSSYDFGGAGVFRGSAWDMSDPGNPRRLNLCFVESIDIGPADQLWNPTVGSPGGREYLFVMLSSYDGTGLTYAANNLINDAGAMDILYGWWPLVITGQSLYASDPATMDITPFYLRNGRGIPGDGQLTLTWSFFQPDPDSFTIASDLTSPATTYLTSVAGNAREYLHGGLINGVEQFYLITAWTNGIATDVSEEFASIPEVVSSEVSLVGYLHDRGTYGDIWAYVDPNTSEEYALLCARNEGLSIIHLVNGGDPVEVAFIETMPGASDSKDVKVYDHYAYLVNENGPIQIIDIDDPANPVEVGSITPDGNGSHNCLVEGEYLYVIGNHGVGGLEIFSLANPSAPVEVGDFQPYYYHDIDIRNDTVYGCGIYGDGMDIIDVSNKAAPSLITTFNYTGSGIHNAELTEDGKYLFNGDEIGSAGNHLRVWKVSDPGSISKVADIIVDPAAVVHNCYVRGDLLYTAYYTEGVRIHDIRDPENPVEVAYYDTYQPANYGYSGCWTVVPHLPSGRIIASDMQTGLYVLELDDVDGDGVMTVIDNCPNIANSDQADADSNGVGDVCEACLCPMQADLDGNTVVDAIDLNLTIDILFFGGSDVQDPNCPASRSDFNYDTVSDAIDLNTLIDHLFFGGAPPVDPCL